MNKTGTEPRGRIDTALLREIADRIDPETRTPDIAGYDQRVYGECLSPEAQRPHECNTVACLAGHAIIARYGAKHYLKTVVSTIAGCSDAAGQALGLNERERRALFGAELYPDELEVVFGVRPPWEFQINNVAYTLDHIQVDGGHVARWLRETAQHLEREQGQRANERTGQPEQ